MLPDEVCGVCGACDVSGNGEPEEVAECSSLELTALHISNMLNAVVMTVPLPVLPLQPPYPIVISFTAHKYTPCSRLIPHKNNNRFTRLSNICWIIYTLDSPNTSKIKQRHTFVVHTTLPSTFTRWLSFLVRYVPHDCLECQ